MKAANQAWLPFTWAFERDYKFANVNAEKKHKFFVGEIPNAKPDWYLLGRLAQKVHRGSFFGTFSGIEQKKKYDSR